MATAAAGRKCERRRRDACPLPEFISRDAPQAQTKFRSSTPTSTTSVRKMLPPEAVCTIVSVVIGRERELLFASMT